MGSIISNIKKEIVRLEGVKKRIDDFLSNAPEGSLKYQIRNGKNYYYHQRVNSKSRDDNNQPNNKQMNDKQIHNKQIEDKYINKVYIKKNNVSLAKALAQKQYYIAAKPIVEKNLKELNHFIENYYFEELEKIYSSLPTPRKQLVMPMQTSVEEKLRQWNEETYEKNDIYPEKLKYETDQGELVRSKSEVIIANLLHKYQKDIIYKYERPLEVIVDGYIKTIYPDFTIFKLDTGEIKYWEHAGRMDDSYYANEFVKKIGIYKQNGLLPGRDVILSFESYSNPLDIGVVKELVGAMI